jgi:hypothetical protein
MAQKNFFLSQEMQWEESACHMENENLKISPSNNNNNNTPITRQGAKMN